MSNDDNFSTIEWKKKKATITIPPTQKKKKKKKTLTMIASLFKMVSPHECKIENKSYAVKNVTYDTLIIIVSMIYLTL